MAREQYGRLNANSKQRVGRSRLAHADFVNGKYMVRHNFVALTDMYGNGNWGSFNPAAVVAGSGLGITDSFLIGDALALALAGSTMILDIKVPTALAGTGAFYIYYFLDGWSRDWELYKLGAAPGGHMQLYCNGNPTQTTHRLEPGAVNRIALTFTEGLFAASINGGPPMIIHPAHNPVKATRICMITADANIWMREMSLYLPVTDMESLRRLSRI